MNNNTIRGRRGKIGAAAALFGLLLAWGAPAATARPVAGDADRFLGVWNYDQPERADGTNIAVVGLLGVNPLSFPQIGTVTFSRGPGDEVIGRTDQGCTWHFAPSGDGLDLTSTDQYCFNNVIQSGYNIYYWHVTVQGDREREQLRANSYQSFGTVDFTLGTGTRTRADVADPADPARLFTGSWAYDPVNPAYLNNLTSPGYQPISGTVRIESTGSGRLAAHTDDGCAWTFDAAGNTAELAPANQVCHTSDGDVSMSFWSLASDGRQLASILNGTDAQGHTYFVGSGSSSRR